MFGRKRDPKLESPRSRMIAGTAAVPGAACGLEPFDAAFKQHAGGARCVFVPHAAFKEVRYGSDAGMGMEADGGERCLLNIKEIQENERLEPFSKVRRTHQSGGDALGFERTISMP